ncbi:unnamed protein product [Toxocara canis]|uniref:Tudor domain-containing protein n=1 Tax=Toxocara canis TaxID=6265 RepID=A0A183UAR3_TOXCA|nr:unnamed protein product [Toxocara canis]
MDGRESPVFQFSRDENEPPKMIPNGVIDGSRQFKVSRCFFEHWQSTIKGVFVFADSSNANFPICNVHSFECHITELYLGETNKPHHRSTPGHRLVDSAHWVRQKVNSSSAVMFCGAAFDFTEVDLDSKAKGQNTLTCLSVAREGTYVMAPLQQGIYARARVVQIATAEDNSSQEERKEYAMVLFIDEGTVAWVSTKCLAKMDFMLSYHPWQAIATALFKIRPRHGEQWNRETTETLRTILSEYEFVRIKLVQNSKESYNNFHTVLKVNMDGLQWVKDTLGCSISYALARRSRDVLCDRLMFDAFEQCLYPYEGRSSEFPFSVPEETWRNAFPTPDGVKEIEFEDQCALWNETGLGPQVKVADVDFLNEAGYFTRGLFLVNVEATHTISPYEFYARPLLVKEMDGGGSNEEDANNSEEAYREEDDAMIAANEELQRHACELNSFYGYPSNRKRIDMERVKKGLEMGTRVYGIAQMQGDLAVFTGVWQRVEIIGLKAASNQDDYYCRIRFLDSGGTDIRLLSTILEIHPMHCDRPPMCLQMCMHSIEPANDEKQWSPEALKFFRRELREDVPIGMNVLGQLNKYV